MLSKLVLRNFQVHKKRTIRFAPRITTIIGDTDGGKTAILRALEWLSFNRLSFSDILSHDADTTTAILDVDKKRIVRQRGPGNNRYSLDNETYRAFGNSVPEDIQNLLRTSEINFQDQHDPPFWFSLSAPQLARELNQIVNLGVIDKSLSIAGQKVKRSQSKLKHTKERLKEAKSKKKELDWVPDTNKRLQNLERLEERIQELEDEDAILNDAITTIIRLQNKVAKDIPNIARLQRTKDRLEGLEDEIALLDNNINSITGAQRNIKWCNNEIAKAKREMDKLMKGKCPLCRRLLPKTR